MNIEYLAGRIDPNNAPIKKQVPGKPGKTSEGFSFKEVMRREGGLEFSGHAMQRLESRSIPMNKQDMMRLEEAVSRAEQKGSKDSLVLDGEHAFLVNIPNRKVVTAVDMMELREKVFTNIDSTVLTKQS